MLLSREAGQGLEVQGAFVRRSGQVVLDLTFVNHTGAAQSDFGIQFNKNRSVSRRRPTPRPSHTR